MVCWRPKKYTGRLMKNSHQHLMITATEWEAFVDDLQQTFDKFAVPPAYQTEIKAIVASTRQTRKPFLASCRWLSQFTNLGLAGHCAGRVSIRGLRQQADDKSRADSRADNGRSPRAVSAQADHS
jgi:hypothetical protein